MLDTARFEARRRLPGAGAVALGLSAYAAMMLLIAPGVLAELDVATLRESFPPALVAALRLEVLGTVEGFLALQLYWFGWLLVLGVYVAYGAAGAVAGDIEDGTMDTLLAAPVSRRRVVLEKYLATLTAVVVVNVVVLAVVYGGTRLVGEPVGARGLLAVHALSVPYLAFWAAYGLLVSVLAGRRALAEGVAAGTLVASFLLETVADGVGRRVLGVLSPGRYYDPVAVLAVGEYDLVGAGLLVVATGATLGAATLGFARRDV